MTFYQFQLLSPRAQLMHVLTAGTYLAQRCAGASRLHLYHVPEEARGFFVEVGYDDATLETLVLRSDSSTGLLADYTQGVRLPKE